MLYIRRLYWYLVGQRGVRSFQYLMKSPPYRRYLPYLSRKKAAVSIRSTAVFHLSGSDCGNVDRLHGCMTSASPRKRAAAVRLCVGKARETGPPLAAVFVAGYTRAMPFRQPFTLRADARSPNSPLPPPSRPAQRHICSLDCPNRSAAGVRRRIAAVRSISGERKREWDREQASFVASRAV